MKIVRSSRLNVIPCDGNGCSPGISFYRNVSPGNGLISRDADCGCSAVVRQVNSSTRNRKVSAHGQCKIVPGGCSSVIKAGCSSGDL